MKKLLPIFLLFLTGCAAAIPPVEPTAKSPAAEPLATERLATPSVIARSDLRDLGVAPELTNMVWINTGAPLHLADLRGKVVLLEMWTFDCINCLHTIPQMNAWYTDFASQGLVIIGNHFPEFPVEADLNNLKAAVKRLGIQYPVAQDNQGLTWNAYNNNYWPTMYLIDKTGHIRYIRIGEGGYDITQTAIQSLLAERYP
jgi:thiol-disulfide isomerase/thioredoxin